MRRAIVLVLLAGLALTNVGCFMALTVKEAPHRKHVVEIDGEFYTVDLRTNRVRRIDVDWETEGETITRTEVEAAGD